jgi:hypothetical protein
MQNEEAEIVLDTIAEINPDAIVLEPQSTFNQAIIGSDPDGRLVYSSNKIANAEKEANSIPRKGMNVYLDKSTMVMQQFTDPSAFSHAKQISSRKGQSSTLRNVLVGGGRLQ